MDSIVVLIIFGISLLYFSRLIKKSINTTETVVDIAINVLDEASGVAQDAVSTYSSKAKVANSSARAEVGADIKSLAEQGKLLSQKDLDSLITELL